MKTTNLTGSTCLVVWRDCLTNAQLSQLHVRRRWVLVVHTPDAGAALSAVSLEAGARQSNSDADPLPPLPCTVPLDAEPTAFDVPSRIFLHFRWPMSRTWTTTTSLRFLFCPRTATSPTTKQLQSSLRPFATSKLTYTCTCQFSLKKERLFNL